MRDTARTLLSLTLSSVLACAASGAFAQDSTPSARQSETPRPQDLEPAVDTSASPADGTQTSPESLEPAVDTSASTPPAGATPPSGNAAAGERNTNPPANAAAASGTQPRGRALDRLELDTTEITGNRELPKVLYIVPWKRSDLGDLVGKPVNSLLDEVLTPVDRDVFKRENRYYRALAPAESGSGSGGAASGPAPANRATPAAAPSGPGDSAGAPARNEPKDEK